MLFLNLPSQTNFDFCFYFMFSSSLQLYVMQKNEQTTMTYFNL